MSVQLQHPQDGGIAERRLRPIYDWLDNGNNKKALQEAEKVLKKSPSLQAARALKALSLLRLGKAEEAHTVLNALAAEKPSDDTTLQAMTISYRESHQLPKVCLLYEAAVKVDPCNEELFSHLFMSYVRVGDYRSQQRVAMALYKFAPKSPYYFWAVMSIILQAKTTDDDTKKNILLTLAQRMIENFIADNKMEAEQEARLYVMILELQEKWGDILKFMEGPLYTKVVPGAMPQGSITYLRKLGEWRKLNLMCKELLWDNQDRWDYYLPYLDSVFELMKSPTIEGVDGESTADDSPEKCHEFICQLVESMSSGRVLRGPYLARLELWKRLAEVGDAAGLLGSPVALCVQYLRVFAHKPCAVPDLRPYIAMIPQHDREKHCREFLTCLDLDENTEPDNMDDIQRHVSCMGAWRLCAAWEGAEAETVARVLKAHYLRALHRGLARASATEACAADWYSVLAAHHYFYAAVQQESSAPVVEALCLLELVHHKSPANYHVKLLLVKFYHLLGNALAADSIYIRLETKYVQLLSLGWLHAARLAPACAHPRALQLLSDTRAFHNHHSKDSLEHLTYSYKFGTFEKLVELLAWSSRLEQCVWSAVAAREKAILSLLAGPAAPLHAPPKLPADPTDNRDLDVIVNWWPPQCADPDYRARSMAQEVEYLRLKDGLVSAVALCIELTETTSIEEKKKHYEALTECTESLGTAWEHCHSQHHEPDRLCVVTPFPSRIIALVNSPVPYRELYPCTLQLAGEVALRSADTARVGQQLMRLVARSRDLLADWLAVGLAATDPLWTLRDTLEQLANYLEYLGVAAFILGVCHELTTPTNNIKKSKKKAANRSPEELKTLELLNDLNKTIQDSIDSVDTIFEKLPTFQGTTTLEEELANLNLNKDYNNPVEKKLKDGYSAMADNVRNVIKDKIKYLKSLIQ